MSRPGMCLCPLFLNVQSFVHEASDPVICQVMWSRRLTLLRLKDQAVTRSQLWPLAFRKTFFLGTRKVFTTRGKISMIGAHKIRRALLMDFPLLIIIVGAMNLNTLGMWRY